MSPPRIAKTSDKYAMPDEPRPHHWHALADLVLAQRSQTIDLVREVGAFSLDHDQGRARPYCAFSVLHRLLDDLGLSRRTVVVHPRLSSYVAERALYGAEHDIASQLMDEDHLDIVRYALIREELQASQRIAILCDQTNTRDMWWDIGPHAQRPALDVRSVLVRTLGLAHLLPQVRAGRTPLVLILQDAALRADGSLFESFGGGFEMRFVSIPIIDQIPSTIFAAVQTLVDIHRQRDACVDMALASTVDCRYSMLEPRARQELHAWSCVLAIRSLARNLRDLRLDDTLRHWPAELTPAVVGAKLDALLADVPPPRPDIASKNRPKRVVATPDAWDAVVEYARATRASLDAWFGSTYSLTPPTTIPEPLLAPPRPRYIDLLFVHNIVSVCLEHLIERARLARQPQGRFDPFTAPVPCDPVPELVTDHDGGSAPPQHDVHPLGALLKPLPEIDVDVTFGDRLAYVYLSYAGAAGGPAPEEIGVLTVHQQIGMLLYALHYRGADGPRRLPDIGSASTPHYGLSDVRDWYEKRTTQLPVAASCTLADRKMTLSKDLLRVHLQGLYHRRTQGRHASQDPAWILAILIGLRPTRRKIGGSVCVPSRRLSYLDWRAYHCGASPHGRETLIVE